MSTWDEILNNPEFQNEPLEKKVAIRDSFFNSEIRPKVEAANGDVEAVRASFVNSNDFGSEEAPAPQQPSELTTTDRMLNTVGDAVDLAKINPLYLIYDTYEKGKDLFFDEEIAEEKPIPIGDDVDWDTVLKSEDFLSQTPYEKRRIAEAFYNKRIEPNVPDEKKEEVRKEFFVSSGLPAVDSSSVAAEQKGALARGKDVAVEVGEWMLSDRDKAQDVKDFASDLYEGASNIDWNNVPSQVWDSLKEMGISAAEYFEEATMGLPDAEFKKQYFVPESESGRQLSTLDRLKYKKDFMERERNAIDAAQRGEANLPEVVSSAVVREQAEREAASTRLSNAVDVVTTLPGLQAVKGATLATKLGGAALNAAKAAGATGAGEVVKNIEAGRDVAENVGEAMLLDSILSGVGGYASAPTAQSTKMAKSVAKGSKEFGEALKSADAASKIDLNVDAALKGREVDVESLRSLDSINPKYRGEIEKAGKASKVAGPTLEKAYKKGQSYSEFSNSFKAVNKGKAVSNSDLESWFNLKNGVYDEAIDLAKSNAMVKNLEKLGSDDVTTFLRARDLEEKGFFKRMGEDVSTVPGAGMISKATAGIEDLTNVGILGRINEALNERSYKKAAQQAAGEIRNAYDDLLSDVTTVSEKGAKESARKVSIQKNKEKLSKAEDAYLDELAKETRPMDADLYDYVMDAVEKKGKVMQDEINKIDDFLVEESLRQPLRAKALKEMGPLLGKEKLSDSDLLKISGAIRQTGEGGPLFQSAAMSNLKGLDDAVTALAGRSKRQAAKASSAETVARAVSMSVIYNFVGLPAAYAKTAIIIANQLAQKSTKRGMVQGVKLAKETSDKIRGIEAEIKKASKANNTAEVARLKEKIKMEEAELTRKLESLGGGVLSGVTRILTQSMRAVDLMEEFEDE